MDVRAEALKGLPMLRIASLARLCALAVSGAAVLAPAPALAADPIMPLSEVRSGMRCTGLSVIRGTEISQFDVEVMDVVGGSSATEGPAILVRASGPAVDVTGIGPGFSGSPIICPGADGVPRNAGAIAYGVGDYGNKVVLVTPIEDILGEPAELPAGARRAPKALASAYPLVGPLTVAGLSPTLARRVELAARRHGKALLAAPAQSLAAFPAQALRPGSAMGVGLASGDLSIGAVGTVAYTDGDRVWGFGHPLEALGRRSLLLQDAYVYSVIGNPLGVEGATTYKLAAPGHTLGTLTNDALAAVVGRVGGPPRAIPLDLVARDLDTGRVRESHVEIADEVGLGVPSETPPLTLAGALTLLEADVSLLRGVSQHLASACVKFTLQELPRPVGYCNRYSETAETAGAASDYAAAASLIEGFSSGRLHVTKVAATLDVRRGVREARLVRGNAARRVRAGQKLALTLDVQRDFSKGERLKISVRVPRGLRPGARTLTLRGASHEEGGSEQLFEELLFGGGSGRRTPTPRDLGRAIESIGRYDGLRASFGGGRSARGERVYRDPGLLLTGRVRVPLRVVGAPRR